MAETPHLKQSNQLSHSQRDACRVKQGTKYCIKKQGQTTHKNINNWTDIQNNESTTTEPPL